MSASVGPEFAVWLQQEQERRWPGLPDKAVVAALGDEGLAISPSVYSRWKSGATKPRRSNRQLAELYQIMGSRPGTENPGPAMEAGIEAAIVGLTSELGDWRRTDLLARVALLESNQRALQLTVDRLVTALAARDDADKRERPAPRARPRTGG